MTFRSSKSEDTKKGGKGNRENGLRKAQRTKIEKARSGDR